MQDSRRPNRIRTCLGFTRTDSICNLLGEQSRDPTFAYKRLGRRSCRDRRLFPPSTRALESSRAPHPRLDPIYALAVNTPTVITPSIKSDKQDVGHYPIRGPNLSKTCVSLCRLIAVEFAGSYKRSMIRKPSSMGIAGVEPRQWTSSFITL
jgi:hypothetical protein